MEGLDRLPFFILKYDQFMPHEITTKEGITEEILKRTLVVYTKKSGEAIKYKLRTKKTLYTFKAQPDQVEDIESKIKNAGNIDIIPL